MRRPTLSREEVDAYLGAVDWLRGHRWPDAEVVGCLGPSPAPLPVHRRGRGRARRARRGVARAGPEGHRAGGLRSRSRSLEFFGAQPGRGDSEDDDPFVAHPCGPRPRRSRRRARRSSRGLRAPCRVTSWSALLSTALGDACRPGHPGARRAGAACGVPADTGPRGRSCTATTSSCSVPGLHASRPPAPRPSTVCLERLPRAGPGPGRVIWRRSVPSRERERAEKVCSCGALARSRRPAASRSVEPRPAPCGGSCAGPRVRKITLKATMAG